MRRFHLFYGSLLVAGVSWTVGVTPTLVRDAVRPVDVGSLVASVGVALVATFALVTDSPDEFEGSRVATLSTGVGAVGALVVTLLRLL
ncbi:hypothetical protein RYH80_16490 [Halobaculum sp. MBLA0147]|uniref:hypothetical protein n=1 Tax=Halobaculum sp. MBLA0147 TaxID=3079934 RepID=UPI003524D38A